jgi:hypothetical protein
MSNAMVNCHSGERGDAASSFKLDVLDSTPSHRHIEPVGGLVSVGAVEV